MLLLLSKMMVLWLLLQHDRSLLRISRLWLLLWLGSTILKLLLLLLLSVCIVLTRVGFLLRLLRRRRAEHPPGRGRGRRGRPGHGMVVLGGERSAVGALLRRLGIVAVVGRHCSRRMMGRGLVGTIG